MLLVLFTMVSARLDSIMLTMLFSGYNIDTALSLSCYHAWEEGGDHILCPHWIMFISDHSVWPGVWRVADPAPLTSDIAISIKLVGAGLTDWLAGWLAGWLTLLPYLLVHN